MQLKHPHHFNIFLLWQHRDGHLSLMFPSDLTFSCTVMWQREMWGTSRRHGVYRCCVWAGRSVTGWVTCLPYSTAWQRTCGIRTVLQPDHPATIRSRRQERFINIKHGLQDLDFCLSSWSSKTPRDGGGYCWDKLTILQYLMSSSQLSRTFFKFWNAFIIFSFLVLKIEVHNIQYLLVLFCCIENLVLISIKLCSDCVLAHKLHFKFSHWCRRERCTHFFHELKRTNAQSKHCS